MVCVAYFTTKDHLGEEGGEAEYVHVIEMPVDMAEFKEWGLDEMARAAGLSNSAYWDELEERNCGRARAGCDLRHAQQTDAVVRWILHATG